MDTRSEVSDALVMDRPVAPEPLGLPGGGVTVEYGKTSDGCVCVWGGVNVWVGVNLCNGTTGSA